MEIRRDRYLNQLICKQHNGLIKVITGLRRCGKSYLLFELFRNHLLASGIAQDHIIEIPFDSFENKPFRDPNVLYPHLKQRICDHESWYYILLDEVQLLDDFESVLNSLLRMKNVDIYVTGSNARFLSKDVITEFRGRGDEIRMHPLSFAEFVSAYPGTKQDAWNEYILYGGLPFIFNFPTPDQKIAFLKSLFEETYISDIVGRHHIRNRSELEDLLNILSSAIGSLTNPEKLKNTFKTIKKSKITSKTIKKYLDCFEDSFLIESAQRYDIKGKAYIETPKKYYFSDLGLRNARINFRQFEQTHSMENVIYNELRMRGYSVDVGVVIIAEKDQEGKVTRKQLEVDFVCNLGSSRYYIQSAYSLPDEAKRTQEIRPFRKIDDSFKKIVITKDIVQPYYDNYGILTVNIYDFLLDPQILEK